MSDGNESNDKKTKPEITSSIRAITSQMTNNLDDLELSKSKDGVNAVKDLVIKNIRNTKDNDFDNTSSISASLNAITAVDADIRRHNSRSNSYETRELERYMKMLTSGNGMRSITSDSMTSKEMDVVTQSNAVSRNALIQCAEHEKVSNMIPEINKVIQNYTRDILNLDNNENDNIYKVFHISDFSDEDTVNGDVITEEIVNEMNDEFYERIIRPYNFEEKIELYVSESLRSGAYPVIIIPYVDLYELLEKSKDLEKKGYSIENFDVNKGIFNKQEELIMPTLKDRVFEYNRSASIIASENYKPLSKFNYAKEYLDITSKYADMFIDEYCICENVGENITVKLKSQIGDLKNEKKKNDDGSIVENNENLYHTVKRDVSVQVSKLLDTLDGNLIITNSMDDKNLLYLANDVINKMLFQSRHTKHRPQASGFDIDVTKSPHYKKMQMVGKKDDVSMTADGGYSEKVQKSVQFTKDGKHINRGMDGVLLKEVTPTRLIPYNIDGVNIGYFLLEEFNGTYGSSYNKTPSYSNTFTGMIEQLGTSDKDIVLGDYINGAPGANAAPNGLSIPGFDNLFNMMNGFNNDDIDDESLEIVVKMVSDIISSKANFGDIKDNKLLTDSLISLIRQKYIIRNKIRFTFIPSHYVTYFSNNLDKDGLPLSLFSGTLFYSYMLIGSRLHSYLIKANKSTYKDMIEVNVGRTNNISRTVRAISNVFSTRNMHVNASHLSSIEQVIKNAAVNNRIITPVHNGERPWVYTEGRPMNDISPDDQWSEYILDSIIMFSDFPAANLNRTKEDEFAKSVLYTNIVYNKSVRSKKNRYEKYTTRLYKSIALYTTFSEDSYIPYFINKINVKFPISLELSITSANDSISLMKTYIDEVATYTCGADLEDDSKRPAIDKFKKKMAVDLITKVDWSKYDELYKVAIDEYEADLLKAKQDADLKAKAEELGNNPDFSGSGGSDYSGGSDNSNEDDSSSDEDLLSDDSLLDDIDGGDGF